jgi:hypothetical protein
MSAAQAPSLESVWQEREEVVYARLFGPMSRGTFVLTEKQFTGALGQTEVDPRWLHHGVIEFGPTSARNSWVYVTTGTSNPWEQPPSEYSRSGVSGIGTELVVEAPNQAEWAIAVLAHMLAYNILLAHGRFGDFGPLQFGARVPLGGSIDGKNSPLTHLAVAEAKHYAPSFTLESGTVNLLHVVGTTESEWSYARAHSMAQLIEALEGAGAFPVTDPTRKAVA